MTPATILIVDDNPSNLNLLETLLQSDGHQLTTAQTGQGALDLVARAPLFDLVLLDVVLPDINGLEVCRRLKNDPATAHIPVVLISAVRTDDDSIRKGLQTGADGYLVKPIEDTAVRAWVRATLRISELQRELARRTAPIADTPEELLARFARLSHAVGSPLQALYAAADMLSLDLPEGSNQRALVTEILSHAERVTEVVATASLLAKNYIAEHRAPVHAVSED